MAAEPINIFSHKQDLAGIVAVLRQMAPDVAVTGPDNAWERITITGPKRWFRKGPTVVFKNDPTYYSGPDWPKQIAGMQGYFSRCPDAPRKPDILRLIGTFRFALAIGSAPEIFLESNDPRRNLIFAVARHLDGVLFTPSGLRDAAGHLLLGIDGGSDPAAVLPAMPAAESKPPEAPTGRKHKSSGENAPDPTRVAKRALCLAAAAGRAFLEVETIPREQAEEERKRILTWTSELALTDELEAPESRLLQTAVGSLPQQAMIDATWRLEGLGVLAWALRRLELPAYDEVVDAGVLLPAVGFLDLNRATELLKSPQLRARDELQRLQDQCFALHWRLRNFTVDNKPMDFRKFARECWFGPLDISLARFAEDDLAVGQSSIAKAPRDEFRKALSIANERHRAINWLVDGGKIYSETDTST